MIIRQSDLASYSRCPQQKKLTDQMKQGLLHHAPEQLSRTAYGSVMHHALHAMEQTHFHKTGDPLATAKATFDYYWQPEQISPICDPVTIWCARDTWHGMQRKAMVTLEVYWERLQKDVGKVLGLEVPFNIPYVLDGEEHTLHGTMDRLSLRRSGSAFLNIEDFKGLALDTPLPTPEGWTTMGEVSVGDRVIGSDGRPTTVIGKSGLHLKPCYRVTFDDTSSIVCDEDHLWTVVEAVGTNGDFSSSVRSAKDLAGRVFANGSPAKPLGQRNLRVPNQGALMLPDADLPIDPYVYGCWLGDGRMKGGEVTKDGPELFDLIRQRGFVVGPDTAHAKPDCETHTVYGLSAALRDAGLLGHRKIPAEYFRGSRQQRLDLLRGLMDTDGSWHQKRKRAVFTTCTETLADSVQELAVSLGWKATKFEVQRTGFGLTVTAWDVCFTPTDDNPFSLPRKAALVVLGGTRSMRRLIVSIEPTLTVQTQCIEVDAADSMYLCGKQMVPTHNSGKDYEKLRWNLQFTIYSYATTREEFWEPWDVPGLYERFRLLPRRGTWISVQGGVKRSDAGYRGPQDYARMDAGLREYIKAVRADIYPLSLTGAVCEYCPFQNGLCGGIPLPAESYGRP